MVKTNRRTFAAVSLLLTLVTSFAALVSIFERYYHTTPLEYKAAVGLLVAVSVAVTIRALTNDIRPELLYVVLLYAMHFTVFLLCVIGPMGACNEDVVAGMYKRLQRNCVI